MSYVAASSDVLGWGEYAHAGVGVLFTCPMMMLDLPNDLLNDNA